MSQLAPNPQPPTPAATPGNQPLVPHAHATVFAPAATDLHNSFAAPNSSGMQASPDKDARKKSLSGAAVAAADVGGGSYRPVAYRTEGTSSMPCL